MARELLSIVRFGCLLLTACLAFVARPACAQLAPQGRVIVIQNNQPVAPETAPVASTTAADNDPYKAVLSDFSVTSDVQGIGQYLTKLHPTPDMQKLVAKLVAKLSDDDFSARDGAMKQLLKMPTIPIEQLEKIQSGGDPEAAWRAKEVLTEGSKKHAMILGAALRTITRKQLKGLTKEVLATFPFCLDDSLVFAARSALAVTARAEDADLLRAAGKDAKLEVRVAAAEALTAAMGPQAAADLKKLLNSADERVRLAAARGLGSFGDRDCLKAFGKLLSAEDISVRAAAIQSLRTMSGEKFTFVAYEKPELRQQQAEVWTKWISEQGATAKLLPINSRTAELGRTLVSFFQDAKIVEYGPDGKQIWQTNILQPWGVQGLSNGHRLVATWGQQQVIEYDESGKEIWKRDHLPGNPYSVERLENGNTLVTMSDANRVLEVTPDGKDANSIEVKGRPSDAHRLADGTTLIAVQQTNKVVEVDSSGKEIWSKTGCQTPTAVHRLENGNTLVAEHGVSRIAEYSRDGKEIWSFNIAAPYDAQRLDNGNTIIAHGRGVTEVDRDGKEVWNQPGRLCNRVSRY